MARTYSRDDRQRRAMFANMQAPRRFIGKSSRVIKRKLKPLGIEAPYKDDLAKVGFGAVAGTIALRAMRHPLGRIAIGFGQIKLIGTVSQKVHGVASGLAQYVSSRRVARALRSSRTRPIGVTGVYLQSPRFPRLRAPWKPPRQGRVIIP